MSELDKLVSTTNDLLNFNRRISRTYGDYKEARKVYCTVLNLIAHYIEQHGPIFHAKIVFTLDANKKLTRKFSLHIADNAKIWSFSFTFNPYALTSILHAENWSAWHGTNEYEFTLNLDVK